MAEIWVVRAGRGGRHASDFEENGIAAIGFTDVAPTSLEDQDSAALASRATEVLGSKTKGSIAAGQLHRFATEIAVGDVVVTPDGETRELLFGEVAGPYQFVDRPAIEDSPHTRQVRWIARRSRDLLPQRTLYSLGALLTVFKPKGRERLLALMRGAPMPDEAPDTQEADDEPDDIYGDLLSRSQELISAKIAELDGYELQALVAGVLRAMGYYTREADPGPDGGVDVVASKDPLAVEPPVIKVQVKARPGTTAGASDVRELAGVLAHEDRGIFVSLGGYTRDARSDATARRLTLIDSERLQELLVEYYDRLDQDTKSLVPLRRLYFP